MKHWLDLVAYAVVALCAVVAWRTLWPRKKAVGDAAGCSGCSACGDSACNSAKTAPR